MPNDKSPEFLLGQIAERTEAIPGMREDIGEIKGKVSGLPCNDHTAKLERVEGRLDTVQLQAAGETPKVTLLWQILLWVAAALVVFSVGVVFGNGGL